MDDRETFASWARQERDDLLRFAVLVTANRTTAVRVVAVALTRLRGDFRTVADAGDPGAAARREIVAAAQRLTTDPVGLPVEPALAPDPELGPARTRAWQVWSALPPGARAAVALHVLDGFSVRQTAWTLGSTEATVRSHVELALMEVGGVATHRGRTTEPAAKAEPVLRDLLSGLVAGRLPVVEIPGPLSGRGWLSVAAAAIAALLVIGAVLWPDGSRPTTAPTPTPTPAATTGRSLPTPATPLPTASILPAPVPGWRWVNTRDVAIQVPDTWRPTRRNDLWGWVELSSDGRTCLAESIEVLACVGSSPVPMVVLEEWQPANPEASPGAGQGFVVSRQVGSVWLIAGAPTAAARELVQIIVNSAVVIATDPLGCTVRHRAAGRGIGFYRPEPAWNLREATFTSGQVTVCRYTKDDNDGRPTLLSSTLLEEPLSGALVDALRAAPPEQPRCGLDYLGLRVIVLRLITSAGPRELYVYPNGCSENYLDDGVIRREVTRAVCTQLGLPVGYERACGG